MNNRQENDFDSFAEDYRNILQGSIKNLSEYDVEHFAEYKIKALKEKLNFSPKNILDFGCGDGISCELFREHFPDATITGVDISSESIKIAKDREIKNSSFEIYNGDELAFKDNSFDLIFAACVFHHIQDSDRKKCASEIFRVLKEEGKVFVFEHNPINPLTRKVVKDCAFDKDAKLIFPKDLSRIFQESGFKKISTNYTLFVPRYKFFNKLFALEKYLNKLPIGAQYYLEGSKIKNTRI